MKKLPILNHFTTETPETKNATLFSSCQIQIWSVEGKCTFQLCHPRGSPSKDLFQLLWHRWLAWVNVSLNLNSSPDELHIHQFWSGVLLLLSPAFSKKSGGTLFLVFRGAWRVVRGSEFLCPQLQRSWRGILLLGCSSVRPSFRPFVTLFDE